MTAKSAHEVALGLPCRHRGCDALPNQSCTRHGKAIKQLHQVRWNDAYRHVNDLAKIADLNRRYGVQS